ncbi:GNAT family N-acetyltransferase [Colwellia psychrerythraea]|uniref:Acetyltransferase, GNAT family n=1 Tax=Colwellia psychrerythraea (strain 34H / ATCC BAA-681) TaxID=167879 RepID=Q48A56_COLP3|nr:GNAT family N-acetyltransferase [Colwellia psychrerythraea]AAZ24877.1 acetyltransferase, GNAT family [Colwellia psychrerythraea 34H]
MEIRIGSLTHPAVIALLEQHHQDMLLHSPEESVHALDLSALAQENISFWCVWKDDALAGCGALKELDNAHGEIKSMRTSPDFLRQGVAKLLVEYIISQATNRGYQKLSLETGTMAAFLPAQKLYQQLGFHFCQPFGNYQEDPFSTFMSKSIC